MLNKKLLNFVKATLIILCLGIFALPLGAFDLSAKAEYVPGQPEYTNMTGLDYTETFGEVTNPARGFYQALEYILDANSDDVPAIFSVENLENYLNEGLAIVHPQFGLEMCSENAYYPSGGGYAQGQTRPLTENMLDCLDQIFENIRQAGQTAIIRFSYNMKGRSESNVGIGDATYINAEPTMEAIEGHIAQLAPLFQKYNDIILSVDAGFLGPWGEMHTTTMAKDINNSVRLLNALLDAVPQNRTVAIRYPGQYTAWHNNTFGTSYTVDNMKNINLSELDAELAARAARIGMFNDGYLGTHMDYGTYKSSTGSRENEATWVAKQTVNTFYGGECVTDQTINPADPLTSLNDYNRIEFFAWEAFKTHTSHLNISWNDTVVEAWRQTPYRVEPLTTSYPASGQSAVLDELYSQNSATAFEYIRDRLGYRLVLREASRTAEVPAGSNFYFKGKIENVGFGNIVCEQNVRLIFKNKQTDDMYILPLDIDARSWQSSAGELDLNFDIALLDTDEELFAMGEYDVYLKINDAAETDGYKDTALRCIRFANNGDAWDANLGANLIASVTVVESLSIKQVRFFDSDKSTVLYEFFLPEGTVLTLDEVNSPDTKSDGNIRYIFSHWEGYTQGMTVKNNINIYAVYDKYQPFVVNFFDEDGFTVLHHFEIAYGNSFSTQQMPSAPDNKVLGNNTSIFNRWELIEGNFVDEQPLASNLDFIAVYDLIMTFKVSFDANGGTLTSGELVQMIVYGEAATAPELVRDGYEFLGWDSDGYDEVTSDMTIKAKWKKIIQKSDPAVEDNCLKWLAFEIYLIPIGAIMLIFASRKRS